MARKREEKKLERQRRRLESEEIENLKNRRDSLIQSWMIKKAAEEEVKNKEVVLTEEEKREIRLEKLRWKLLDEAYIWTNYTNEKEEPTRMETESMKKLMQTVKKIKIEERVPKFANSGKYSSKWLDMINRCLKYKSTFNMGRVGYYEEFGI